MLAFVVSIIVLLCLYLYLYFMSLFSFCCYCFFFFFKQKTAYEMRISDWSSTCALPICSPKRPRDGGRPLGSVDLQASLVHAEYEFRERSCKTQGRQIAVHPRPRRRSHEDPAMTTSAATESRVEIDGKIFNPYSKDFIRSPRSEEHTSEVQSRMRNS